ncbi:hypothetical protein BJY04DRAFT_188076 [Aspergillus karnatakaensis]|uniref:uncharacterized protein n=1 Tax=Aspergillus karnatakaensis TaxID=1810916 RepID=UPI003CCC9B45
MCFRRSGSGSATATRLPFVASEIARARVAPLDPAPISRRRGGLAEEEALVGSSVVICWTLGFSCGFSSHFEGGLCEIRRLSLSIWLFGRRVKMD